MPLLEGQKNMRKLQLTGVHTLQYFIVLHLLKEENASVHFLGIAKWELASWS